MGMRISAAGHIKRDISDSGFTIAESVVAMGIVGLLVVALYSGMTTASVSVRLGRENHRATQVIVEKMEEIRLFNWEQVNSNGYVPTNFIAGYYSSSPTNINTNQLIYTGTVAITAYPWSAPTYSNDLRL